MVFARSLRNKDLAVKYFSVNDLEAMLAKPRLYFNDFRQNEKENNCSRWAPLSNHQFAAVHLFELHGFFQGDDRTLDFAVIGRLGGDSLQPQAGCGHQREQ